MEGFQNLDLVLGHRLPECLYKIPAGAVSLIRSEHFIEHLTFEEGLALTRELTVILATVKTCKDDVHRNLHLIRQTTADLMMYAYPRLKNIEVRATDEEGKLFASFSAVMAELGKLDKE